jgi:signal transduction histidine kinase
MERVHNVISSDLHDEVGSSLTSISILVKWQEKQQRLYSKKTSNCNASATAAGKALIK